MLPARTMVARIGADITDFQAKLRQAWTDADEFRRKTEQADDKAQSRVKSLLGTVSRTQAAFAGVAGSAIIAGFGMLAEQANVLENQMRGIGIATDESRDKIYRLAIETRTPIAATVGLMRSMTNSLKGQDMDRTIRQVATLNRLLTVGGLDAGQRGSVSLQFGQALQSGVLQGDELRSLRESAPYEMLEAIAKAAGGTVASLRTLGEQGKITTDVMVEALDNLEQVSKDKFADFTMTVGESAVVLQTALVQAAGRMNEGLGFTDVLANAQASLAGILQEGGDAAEALGSSLRDLTQIALIAAGARGLTAVGTAMTAINAGAITLTSTFAAVRGAMSGVLALLGGPWGAAFFAAGVAAMVLAKNTDTAAESLEKSSDAMRDAATAAASAAGLRDSINTDHAALEEAEQRIADAIRDQATAAEDTARREAISIRSRITMNTELLELQQTMAKAALAQSQEELDEARETLVRDARNRLIADTNTDNEEGRPDWGNFNSRVEQIRGVAAMAPADVVTTELTRLQAKVDAGQKLVEAEWEFLRQYGSLTEAEKRLAEERKQVIRDLFGGRDYTPDMGTLVAEREKIAATMNDLLEKEDKRNKRLAELKRAREQLDREMATAGGTDRERQTMVLRIQAADEEIRKLTDAQNRVEAVQAQIARIKDIVAVMPSENADPLRDMLDVWLQKLGDVEAAGEDVNNVELTELEAGIASLIPWADELLAKFQEIAGVDLAQAVNRMKLPDLPLAWRDQINNLGGTDPKAMAAARLIAQKEDFRNTPYWDVNAWRAGFGSDTFTDSLGQVQKVQQGQSVSQDDAIRDLARRIGDYFDEQKRLIGPAWAQFTDEQTAALASIQHNYGSLPPRIIDELRTGNNKAIAEAIAGLAMDNPELAGKDGLPVNYHRRMEEASAFGTSERVTEMDAASREAADNAKAAAEARKQWLETMQDGVEQARIEAEIAGLSEYAQQRILFVEQKKLEARRAGIELSAADLANIEAAADAEIETLRAKGAIQKQQQEEQARADEQRQAIEERRNEQMMYAARMQDEIVNGSVQTLMNARSWGDVLEGIGGILEDVLGMYVEALFKSALFGQGPRSEQTGGSGGLLGGLMNIGTAMLGGTMGGGGMGGDPLSAALSGAGVPSSMMSMSAMPDFSLPSMFAAIAPAQSQSVDVNVNLVHPMLEAEIRRTSNEQISAAAPNIQNNAQRATMARMRASKSGWAD